MSRRSAESEPNNPSNPQTNFGNTLADLTVTFAVKGFKDNFTSSEQQKLSRLSRSEELVAGLKPENQQLLINQLAAALVSLSPFPMDEQLQEDARDYIRRTLEGSIENDRLNY